MAKIKNVGAQPRGFITESGEQVILQRGEEREFNMTEADFKHLQQAMENHGDPKPLEVSGSHGGADKKREEKPEDEMPAQSTEPPPPASTTTPVTNPNPTTPSHSEKRTKEEQRSTREEPRTTNRRE
jgi:hypothetical protein